MCPLRLQYQPIFLLLMMVFLMIGTGCSSQRRFDNPDEAVASLVDSLRTGDEKELHSILGSSADDLLFSGDAVEDHMQVQKFLTAFDGKHQLTQLPDGEMSLSIGTDDWPLPIPLVQDKSQKWMFDTAAGKDEIINRRIGRNELDTIQSCLAFVDAQMEYADADPDHTGLPVYAQKFFSDPGKKNGLYWETKEGEAPSPFGEFAAEAGSQGYSLAATTEEPRPYHGYLFRILKSQGPAASGGARDYLIGDRMISGFALIAYPADYENSGIMSFIVNQDGVVYQRDLGPDTAKIARQTMAFNPDANWRAIDSTVAGNPATQPAK